MGGQCSKRDSGITQEEIEQLKQCTDFKGSEIQSWYRRFHEDYPDGAITKPQFIQTYQNMYPHGNATMFANYLFHAYDVDQNGVIDFKEFLLVMSVAAKGSVVEKLKWAFKLYDLDGSGQVTRREAIEIIQAIFRMKGNDKTSAEEAAFMVFCNIDKNHDDILSEDEFVTGVSNNPDALAILSAYSLMEGVKDQNKVNKYHEHHPPHAHGGSHEKINAL